MNSQQPVYGNYRSYYQTRRSAVYDERIALLPEGFFAGKTVLDIGCNEGWVSCEIAQRHGASRVLGVDIDSALVASAWRRRKYVWSLAAPPGSTPIVADPPSSRKRKRKSSSKNTADHAETPFPLHISSFSYFPTSMPHLFGTLTIPPREDEDDISPTFGFPYNVGFRTTDWLTETRREEYDVILALSITKWIHLNNGDAGLLSFFQKAYDSLKPNSGSKLVLEPQHWEGYAKAKRMDARLKENAKSLEIRPEDFEKHLREIGFKAPVKMGSVGQGGLNRPVDVYERP